MQVGIDTTTKAPFELSLTNKATQHYQLGHPCIQKSPPRIRYGKSVGHIKVDFRLIRVYIVVTHTHDVTCWVMVLHITVLAETTAGHIFHAFRLVSNKERSILFE